jgi:hypothetical protein
MNSLDLNPDSEKYLVPDPLNLNPKHCLLKALSWIWIEKWSVRYSIFHPSVEGRGDARETNRFQSISPSLVYLTSQNKNQKI